METVIFVSEGHNVNSPVRPVIVTPLQLALPVRNVTQVIIDSQQSLIVEMHVYVVLRGALAETYKTARRFVQLNIFKGFECRKFKINF